MAILYYDKQAVKLVGDGVMVEKLRIDQNKVLKSQSFGASSSTRQLIPRYDSFRSPIDCYSGKRKDTIILMAYLRGHQLKRS